jgi:hypothetical protein
MNELKIQIQKDNYEDEKKPIDVISFYIDNKNLLDIIKDIENPYAEKEGHPSLAGNYKGLKLKYTKRDYLLGIEDAIWGETDDKTAIYECSCGEPGCWPLVCKIIVTENTIIWKNFEQIHRNLDSENGEWNYGGLMFEFDKMQYMLEINNNLKN